MNMDALLLNFDATIRGRLGADFYKNNFKLISYNTFINEWE